MLLVYGYCCCFGGVSLGGQETRRWALGEVERASPTPRPRSLPSPTRSPSVFVGIRRTGTRSRRGWSRGLHFDRLRSNRRKDQEGAMCSHGSSAPPKARARSASSPAAKAAGPEASSVVEATTRPCGAGDRGRGGGDGSLPLNGGGPPSAAPHARIIPARSALCCGPRALGAVTSGNATRGS